MIDQGRSHFHWSHTAARLRVGVTLSKFRGRCNELGCMYGRWKWHEVIWTLGLTCQQHRLVLLPTNSWLDEDIDRVWRLRFAVSRIAKLFELSYAISTCRVTFVCLMYLDIGEVTKSTRFLFLKNFWLSRSLTDTSSCVLSHAAHAIEMVLLK